MFTGIIEEIGIVKKITHGMGGNARLRVKTSYKDITIGESMAVNGTCLSVVSIEGNDLEFDVSKETFSRTTTKHLSSNSEVNLERAIKADGRFSGHFVQGHVDGVAILKKITQNAFMKELSFELPDEKMIYVVEKGSIAVNGVSLTINSIFRQLFSVMIVPLTLEKTNLGRLKENSQVNIEFDIIGKYVARFVKGKSTIIDEQFLKEHGF